MPPNDNDAFEKCSNEVVTHIVSYLEPTDMRRLVQVNKKMKAIVENTPTQYEVKLKKGKNRLGTYAEIRDLFKKRQDGKLEIHKIEPDNTSRYLASDVCVKKSTLIGSVVSGIVGGSLISSSIDSSAAILIIAGIGSGFLISVTTAGVVFLSVQCGNSFFKKQFNNKMIELEKQKRQLEINHPKPLLMKRS